MFLTYIFYLHVFFFIQVSNYTREAGVRGLERKIGALCRAVAVQIALEESIKPAPIIVDIDEAKNILGVCFIKLNDGTFFY